MRLHYLGCLHLRLLQHLHGRTARYQSSSPTPQTTHHGSRPSHIRMIAWHIYKTCPLGLRLFPLLCLSRGCPGSIAGFAAMTAHVYALNYCVIRNPHYWTPTTRPKTKWKQCQARHAPFSTIFLLTKPRLCFVAALMPPKQTACLPSDP
jgi:hypothetical protein